MNANFAKRVISLGLAATCIFAAANSTWAQSYPTRPIRLIVPASSGSGGDSLARVIGQQLGETWGVQIVVDLRPGAGNVIATDLAAKSAPDGYTLLLIVNPFAINPALRSRLPYDTVRDFAPITLTGLTPHIAVVHPSVPVKSIRELVRFARSRPGQINYASSGTGSAPHLAVELFMNMTGVKLTHVPYKGGTPGIIDLMAGRVSLAFPSLPLGLPQVRLGKLRALAVTTSERSPAIPDLPTVAESGIPGYEASIWYGVVVPAGTPSNITVKLNSEIVKTLRMPDTKDRFAKLGIEPRYSTPEHLGAFIVKEIEKWGKVVKATGLRAD